MSEDTPPSPDGPHDDYLAGKLSESQAAYPERPIPWHRMALIRTFHEDRGVSPKEARLAVDDWLQRKGLGMPQPSLWFAAVFAVIVAVVLIGPFVVGYFLWQLFAGP
jgi:hypothetical protein